MLILFSLGLFSIGLVFLNTYVLLPLNQDRKLLRIIISIIICLSYTWLTTEILSLLDLILFSSVLISWFLFISCNIIFLLFNRKTISQAISPTIHIWPIKLNQINWILIAVLVFLAFQLGVLAYLGYSYPPNNWDSMTYHMARVMHWSQNQSIAPYPTNILRQIQLSPFAEYQILTVYTLTGNDYFVNFVQLFAFGLCLICVAEITSHLMSHRNEISTAVILCSSIPMAILQATSTQNDLVASSLQTSFVAIGLTWIKDEQHRRLSIPLGLSLGLAILTKATTIVFLLPFCVYLGYGLLKSAGKKAILSGALVGILVVATNLGFWIQNYEVFGSPTGPSLNVLNDIATIDVVASNLIRNTALHYLPYENGGPIINRILLGVLQGLSRLHSLTSSLSITDQRTSWTSWSVFTLSGSFHEDTAGNPIHATLIIISFVIFFVMMVFYKRFIKPEHFYYGLCIASGIFLFSWLFKWQPWGSRLQLPFFILSVPFISTFLFRNKHLLLRIFYGIILAGTALVSLLWLFNNATRPFVPYEKIDRTKAFFAIIPSMEQDYLEMVNSVPINCSIIGLAFGDEGYEYPLWPLLKERGFKGRIDFVFVQNQSEVLVKPRDYCSIISMKPLDNLSPKYELIQVGEYYIYNLDFNPNAIFP